jgi:hypothetical protein
MRTRTPGRAPAGSPIATSPEIRLGATARCQMRQGENPAKRVPDDRDLVQLERVEDVIEQPPCVLADPSPPEGDRVGEAVPGKVHGKEPQVRGLREEWRRSGCTQRYAMEQGYRRAASVGELSHAKAGSRELEDPLVDVGADNVEESLLGLVDTLLELPHSSALVSHRSFLPMKWTGQRRAGFASRANSFREWCWRWERSWCCRAGRC